MDLNEINNDIKEKEEHKDLFKIALNLENENYLLKIFPSKDNISLILKLEKEKVKTYYYYGKFFLNELKKIDRRFYYDKNIYNCFNHLKEISQKNIIKLEKQPLKMNISFIKNNSEIFAIYTLRKKIVEQNRLNYQLNEEILNISNDVNNMNFNDLDNCKNNDINLKNKKINKNIFKINEKENKLLKENLSSKKDNQKGKTEKGKIKNDKNSSKEPSSLFNLKNLDILKNRKIYEALIIFNIIASIIVIYLLYYINDLKSYLMYRMEDQGLLKKITLLNLLENYQDDDNNGIRDNIIDFQLQNTSESITYDENNNKKKKLTFIIRRKKYLLNNEREKRYFRKHIKRKIPSRVDDIDFELMYNSHDSYRYIYSYTEFNNMTEILVIMRTKEGKRYGLFTNNTMLYEKEPYTKGNIFAGYSFSDDSKINEINLKVFYENYAGYMQSICDFLKNEKLNLENNISNETTIMGDIDLFEIYEVKYIK